MKLRVGILWVALCFFSYEGLGQATLETFGKNRIQYRSFDWQYLSGEDFDVYYYGARVGVAREAMTFLEGEFDRITDLIGYPPYFKTKVFVYNSLTDLRQSNVGLNRNIYTVGGETEFIKPYVEVAHLGNAQDFKKELLFKISELMVNEMMFGGTLKEIFQSALLMNLPDWFVDGASRYVAYGWDEEMDDYMRQYVQMGKTKKLGRLQHDEAALVGQSVWNYVAEKYGKSSIQNILNYTRVTRNEENSIQLTLGVSYRQLLTDWEHYYAEMEAAVAKSYSTPADSMKFTLSHNKTTRFTTVKMSPDGRYIAYAENDRGRFIVKVVEFGSGKEKVIISGGTKVIGQRVDYNVPLISWADDHTLGVIGVKNGDYVFWLYDLSTKSKIPRELDRFSNIRSFDFSANGRLVVVSADFEGQNDLFLLSSRRDRVRRLTNDAFDDLDPSFMPGSNAIVFSSNRVSDTLVIGKKVPIGTLTDNYNLYSFDLDTTKRILTRITNTLSKDYAPLAIDNSNIVYLSDQRGIVNLFKYNMLTGVYSQITNYPAGILEYDFNYPTKRLAVVTMKDLRESIFVTYDFSVNRQVFTPATRRKELQQVQLLRERRRQDDDSAKKNLSIKDLLNQKLKENQEVSDTVNVSPDQSLVDTVKTLSDSTTVVTAEPEKPSTVNTDDYQFEDDTKPQPAQSDGFLARYRKASERTRITGPFPYESKFGYDNLITSIIMDPLRGLGIKLETQMNDMLENYRFTGGIMTSVDLRNGDVFGEVQYLPKFIDYSVRFDRKAIRWPQDGSDNNEYKYLLHRLEFGASYPVSDRIRVTIKPFFSATSTVHLGMVRDFSGPPRQLDDILTNYYGGVRSEFTYDNSVMSGLNIIEGTRGKVVYQHHQGLNEGNKSFSQVSADVRHYQKIYKEIVFAVRGYAGAFFGQSPKTYLLGGMDNWVFNSSRTDGTTSQGEQNPLGMVANNQNLLFAEFATNLRGFDYGTQFGNNVLLLNAELRVPLARAFASGPISSNFFRNMQLTAFYDIGSSWSGPPPFRSENSVSYKVIDTGESGVFEIQLKDYLNPWLYSYGVGFRSMILGYYLKFDLAWPVENYEVQEPQFHFTLGFDF